MNRTEQIKVWTEVGKELKDLVSEKPSSRHRESFQTASGKAEQANAWFTPQSISTAISGIAKMLDGRTLEDWLSRYPDTDQLPAKKVGVIMAGNIPLAGFHDFLCVLLSGHSAIIKHSSSDQYLLPFVASILFDLAPELKSRVSVADQLKNIDAIIATGSNNTSRYFEYYFGKLPHIFRKNRNSAAVLTGKENEFDLLLLGRDIFTYFGMGCRNVSKLYVPEGYEFDEFYRGMVEYGDVLQHTKYMNNHDYHQALYLLNSEKFLTNNFLIIRRDQSLSSPVGVLHYENYSSDEELAGMLEAEKDHLQCVVSKKGGISFGQAQFPEVWDYADGVDTMKFLTALT